MKHIIITATDSKYGDFLIHHWLKSLKENTNLTNIDILVLDYGLTKSQVKRLKKENVLVKKGIRNGHVVNIRYRDIAKFLSQHEYDQVLAIDSGDIIFQTDISHIFKENKDHMRAFVENYNILNFNKLFSYGFIKQSIIPK